MGLGVSALVTGGGAAAVHGGAAHAKDPPVGHTGGFGEPTCQACHFQAELNPPGGTLVIDGVPARYRPGESYRLAVALRRDDMRRAGFELAARFAEGALWGGAAGSLRPVDGRVALSRDDQTALDYAHHTAGGTELTAAGTSVWELVWNAPGEGAGPVAFHAAANAANDDDSELGDFVYTSMRVSAERAPRRWARGRR